MELSDKQREELRAEIFELLKEAHIKLFQYNTHVHPGWMRVAGNVKVAAGQLLPGRIGEIIDSPNEGRRRNEAAAKKPVSPKREPTKKALTAKKPTTRKPRAKKADA